MLTNHQTFRNKIYTILFFGFIFGLAIGYALIDGYGHAIDWRDFRLWSLELPHEQGIWNPPWAKFILFPVAHFPPNVGHLFLNILTVLAIAIAQRAKFLPYLTKWVHSELWYGNLDGFSIFGILVSRLKNPYLVGIGLFLLSFKPQFFPLALYYVYRAKNVRLLLIPFTFFGLSLIYLGNWIPEWMALMPPTPKPDVSISLFPWSLPIWLLLPLVKDKERFIFTATTLTMPYFNALSLIVLFAFAWPTWMLLIFIIGSWAELNMVVAIIALLYALFCNKDGVLKVPFRNSAK